ncbi:hypothetical protein BDB00DRAFT_870121 [Zychaea mexicana]|uniref:uncharacterized protein n=1 Tax=Zychaea mexicana TaxID=64656 RepID=UPI0022FEF2D2|nr:uncharacterized protein BDB00DRAFT_870121 [Zychaea mexicana]KAI9495894.1 hypothetical protein BDB00DRAFT_870121 [Zychaea mexicana]
MVHSSIIGGVVTQSVEFAVRNTATRDPFAKFTVSASRPDVLMYLVENNVAEGHAVVCYGNFQISKYRNNRGVMANSFRLAATVVHLGLQWRTIIGDMDADAPVAQVTREDVLERLEATAAFASRPSDSQMAEMEIAIANIVAGYFAERRLGNSLSVAQQLFGRLGR